MYRFGCLFLPIYASGRRSDETHPNFQFYIARIFRYLRNFISPDAPVSTPATSIRRRFAQQYCGEMSRRSRDDGGGQELPRRHISPQSNGRRRKACPEAGGSSPLVRCTLSTSCSRRGTRATTTWEDAATWTHGLRNTMPVSLDTQQNTVPGTLSGTPRSPIRARPSDARTT